MAHKKCVDRLNSLYNLCDCIADDIISLETIKNNLDNNLEKLIMQYYTKETDKGYTIKIKGLAKYLKLRLQIENE